MIFVFGSNLAGVHGAGAARFAKLQHGAVWGKGIGLQGNSYAIPTKDHSIKTLPIARIHGYVQNFLDFAVFDRPDLQFQVTCIGCGLAGLKHEEVAPMFVGASSNCSFDTAWQPWLGGAVNYWGTF